MTGCVLHGTLPTSQPWFCDLSVAVYDFQTLIAGVLAIGAAYYAARPVWRQLKDCSSDPTQLAFSYEGLGTGTSISKR